MCEILKVRYVGQFSDGLALVEIGESWRKLDAKKGYLDKKGNLTIRDQYTQASAFREGMAQVSTSHGKYYYINTQNEDILEISNSYEELGTFSEGLAYFYSHSRDVFGYINKQGEEVITLLEEYETGADFHEGLAHVFDYSGKCGYINTLGELVIPYIYDDCGDFERGFAATNLDQQQYIIDVQGQVVYKCDRLDNEILDLSEGILVIKESEGRFIIHDFVNRKQVIIENKTIKYIYSFREEIAIFRGLNGKCGCINLGGEIVVSNEYQELMSCNEGLIGAKLKGNWGFINQSGHVIIPFCYSRVQSFSDEIAVICKRNKLFLINKEGEKIKEFHRQFYITCCAYFYILLALILIAIVAVFYQCS